MVRVVILALILIGILCYYLFQKPRITKLQSEEEKNDPDNFRLKFVESWFSEDYVHIKYSTNKGKTWNWIYSIESPTFSYENYSWTRLTYRLGSGDFKYEKEKFSSYEKIKKYNEEIDEKFRKLTTQRVEKWNNDAKRRKEALKKANE